MAILCLLRHGESLWNEENRFTGWVDVPLTDKGRQEALKAGLLLKDYKFDVAYTSVLQRAIETLELTLTAMGARIPIIKDWHLNERHYGDLQGLNKEETAKIYGEEQVKLWRRSYKVSPPNGESLEVTQKRTVPFFKNTIMLDLKKGKNVLVVAHGNSLRSIVMFLENIPEDIIPTVEIPTGQPIIYETDWDHKEDKLIIKSKKVLS
ncbi:MAG: 2,3-bisphosphoglycerate-dependent phosphoglycerate mutase [Caldisphaera sp.]|jgi:2,3-bisphosphoglycerate-dependent phosphoglycerate mutase|nr:2,3-bisphosphoglycerate-dependent phosphoglycerate mutase [Caldisphaera sp.]PMP59415.1 MAG: 2,3-bisphosphoglycerate-dependent phosphoglycerate mutase [Caldisphaera sp.]